MNKKESQNAMVAVPRYLIQNAETAMKDDVVRALVELIINDNDTYNRLEQEGMQINGLIQILVERKRKGKASVIKILDMGEGMTSAEMKIKLTELGGKTSGFMESMDERHIQGPRGLMGRGSKDCVIFGALKYQSIKDGMFSEIELKNNFTYDLADQRKATKIDRFNLGIENGNGTLATLTVESRFPIPSHESLVYKLSKYYSLRDIIADPKRKGVLIDINNKKKDRLHYNYPGGDSVFDEQISIAGYPEVMAHLVIKRSAERIKVDDKSPYWEGGILIKSPTAIHGMTSLSREIANNPYFESYFGFLSCEYIDRLAHEYEERMDKKQALSEKNPSLIIDSLRAEGLRLSHPFTKALYAEAAKHLNVLLKKDENAATQKTREIENEKTKDRFKRLANEMSKFIKENTEDPESLGDDNYLTPAEIPAGGMLVIPGGLKIPFNEERKIYVYCRPLSEQDERHVTISTESDLIKINTKMVKLADREDGILIAPITVTGGEVEGSANIKFEWGNVVKYLPISIVDKISYPTEIKDFQFEKDNYSIKEGKIKNIKIFAHWPEVICGRVRINLSISDSRHCELLTKNIVLDYDRDSRANYSRWLAIGIVKVGGTKEGGPVILSAVLGNRKISTKLRIVPKKEFGKNFEIKIVDEDLGEQRAVLMNNVMKINGRHKNIKRYLGPPEKFEGQDSIYFRLLIAELTADTVARRVLESNAQQYANEYKDMDASSFYTKHREFMNAFLEKAHRIQIPDNELEKTLKKQSNTEIATLSQEK